MFFGWLNGHFFGHVLFFFFGLKSSGIFYQSASFKIIINVILIIHPTPVLTNYFKSLGCCLYCIQTKESKRVHLKCSWTTDSFLSPIFDIPKVWLPVCSVWITNIINNFKGHINFFENLEAKKHINWLKTKLFFVYMNQNKLYFLFLNKDYRCNL